MWGGVWLAVPPQYVILWGGIYIWGSASWGGTLRRKLPQRIGTQPRLGALQKSPLTESPIRGVSECSFLRFLPSFFIFSIFLCLAQATAVKKNSGFPEGSRSFFFSADGQRARSEGSRAIKKKK